MKIKKFSLFRLKLIFFASIILICTIALSSFSVKNNIKKKNELVSEKLISISQLATTKYTYSNVISIKDSLTLKNITIPFTEKSFVIKYNGYITAGVDLSRASFTITDNALTISIPKCVILSHAINEDEIFIYDEKTSLFNKLSLEDMLKEVTMEKSKTEAELSNEGFLDKVTVDTISFLKNFFTNIGFSKVDVKVVTSS